MKPEPFIIDIPDERLAELNDRIRATAWPGDFGNADWRYGVEQDWLRSMAAYWADEYDWRAEEARMNRWTHFRVVIDGVPIHFAHIRSGRRDSIPLLLSHGWPWTFWDWHDVVERLSGADADPAFDLVVPSLPGVAFSSPLRTPGLNVRAIARLWRKLMVEVLGYDSFAAGGGDWGALITSELGHSHALHLRAIHLTLAAFPGLSHLSLTQDDYALDEQWMVARNAEAAGLAASHVAVQASDPQTLAYALADSPVGTAAWIWERRLAWRDNRSTYDKAADRKFLCTTAALYWLTNTIGSSLRIYKEQFVGGESGLAMNWPLAHQATPSVPVATGLTVAPKELVLMPRSVAAEHVALRRWTPVDRGGHFLPYEEPDIVAEEYRTFFGEYSRMPVR